MLHKPAEIYQKAFLSYFLIIFSQVELQKVILDRSKILGMFVYLLAADDEYFCHHKENVPLPIQMQLSKKQETFWCFLFYFGILIKF